MPPHYNVWQWGPNDPILQEVSCNIVDMYTEIYMVRSTLVNHPRGRGTKFFGPIVNMEVTTKRRHHTVNIFVLYTRQFMVHQMYYLVSSGSMVVLVPLLRSVFVNF